jgi:hypothetical protein
MKILEEIEEANYWRESELTSLLKILICIRNEDDKKTLLNASIPLIYAHWEGFVSSSLKILMETLNEKELNCIDIHMNILTSCYEINLKEDLSNPTYEKESFKKKCKKLEYFVNLLNSNLKFQNFKVDTKSNLNFSVLEILCKKFNFNFKNFKDLGVKLEKLIKRRNGIAHGENSFLITKGDMEESIKLYIDLSGLLKNEIEVFINEYKYLKS